MTFDDEARRAATALREATASLPVPEIDDLHAPRRSRGRTALIAAVCTLVVALVAGAFTIGRSSGHGKRVTTTVLPGTWERIPFASTGFEANASVAGIVQGGPGLVAVGSMIVPVGGLKQLFGNAAGAAWVSPDGRRWRRVALPTPTPALDFIVTTPHGLVAVGPSGTNGPSTVLHSDDGIRWDTVTATAPPNLTGVVAGGPGLVAGGMEDVDGRSRTVIWSSSNGRTWARAPGGPSLFPSGTVVGVAARPGALVAVGVGYAYPVPPVTRATTLVWTSSDGVHWELRRDLFGAGVPESVAASENGFLIGGIQPAPKGSPTSTTTTSVPPASRLPDGARCSVATLALVSTGDETTWTSPDGRVWKPGATPTSPLDGARPLLAAHGWWIAGGSTGDPRIGTGAATWASPDGVTWVRGFTEPPPPPGPCGPQLRSVRAASPTASGAVLVTGRFGVPFGTDSPTGPEIWLWTPPRDR